MEKEVVDEQYIYKWFCCMSGHMITKVRGSRLQATDNDVANMEMAPLGLRSQTAVMLQRLDPRGVLTMCHAYASFQLNNHAL